MNAPRIRYTKAPDGTNIAYSSMGQGAPLVYVPSYGAAHLELEWQFPEIRAWYEGLARNRRLIRYDGRGSGLSDRNGNDFSLDAMVGDLEAVIRAEGLQKTDLLGFYHGGPIAVAYAAGHPEAVSRLVLWQTWARTADRFKGSPQVVGVRELLKHDFDLFTETLAHTLLGWDAGERARRFAAFIREAATQEDWTRATAAANQFDVTPLLCEVQAPTLILHRRQNVRVPLDLARGLAAGIRDGHLVLLDGDSAMPYLGDVDSVLRAIEDFLATDEGFASPAVDQAVAPVENMPATTSHDQLSPREREVALLVAQGMTNREIAECLVITEGTATLHVKHVLAKLGFRLRAQIAAWAVSTGMSAPGTV